MRRPALRPALRRPPDVDKVRAIRYNWDCGL